MGAGAAPRPPKGKMLVMKDLQQVTGNRQKPNRSTRTSEASSIPPKTAKNR